MEFKALALALYHGPHSVCGVCFCINPLLPIKKKKKKEMEFKKSNS